MNWILDYVIDELKSRVQALEKVIQDNEVSVGYKLSKQDEIKFLQMELEYIDEMMLEEVKQFEELEDDVRTVKADAQI